MVYAKTQLFENELRNNAELFKALAHPARLAILKYLSETNTCITGDFAEELPLSRTTVNQHLKELKDAGIIQGKTEGAKTFYCLNPGKIQEMKEMFLSFFDQINTNKDNCCN